MTQSFCEFHLFEILNSLSEQTLPLDVCIRNYFKSHKSLGSHDRKFIAETIYGMVRWQGLLDHFTSKERNWNSRFEVYQELDPLQCIEDATIPDHVRLSFPLKYFTLLQTSLGDQKAQEFCLTSNFPAPTTVRVNTLKTDRDTLLAKWKNLYNVSACPQSPYGIRFHKRENFFGMPEFKEGLFEVQDEASQLVADLVQARPGQQVLDFCSGSGGKALAFAPRMKHRGQIYLHDIRPYVLYEAKKRLKRAGIQNAQVLFPDEPKKEQLKNTMDWVLVDAPCSGSGTLRRNPDMKWKFDSTQLSDLIEDQRQIFEEALSYMNPRGRIVYATCSVLPQENEQQVEYFKEKFGLTLSTTSFSSFPEKDAMDGFFGAVLERPRKIN